MRAMPLRSRGLHGVEQQERLGAQLTEEVISQVWLPREALRLAGAALVVPAQRVERSAELGLTGHAKDAAMFERGADECCLERRQLVVVLVKGRLCRHVNPGGLNRKCGRTVHPYSTQSSTPIRAQRAHKCRSTCPSAARASLRGRVATQH